MLRQLSDNCVCQCRKATRRTLLALLLRRRCGGSPQVHLLARTTRELGVYALRRADVPRVQRLRLLARAFPTSIPGQSMCSAAYRGSCSIDRKAVERAREADGEHRQLSALELENVV